MVVLKQGFSACVVCVLLFACHVVFGQSAQYNAEVLVGFGAQGTKVGFGPQATLPGPAATVLAASGGRTLYIVGTTRILRYDTLTQQVDVLAGLEWPGYADGPGKCAMFNIDVYQMESSYLSPDEKRLYVMDQYGGAVRVVDLATGEVNTLGKGVIPGALRAMAVGNVTGIIYISTWSGTWYKVTPEGLVTKLTNWVAPVINGQEVALGYMAVDENRQKIFGLERNHPNGVLFEWPSLNGGDTATLMNNPGYLRPRDDQYSSDGPVSGMAMANPAGLHLFENKYIVIGAGDGRNFRRVDPDSMKVYSLCRFAKNQYYWGVATPATAGCFSTWPATLTSDSAGNGYFAFSIQPFVVRLRHIN
jgi:hypothetical protein